MIEILTTQFYLTFDYKIDSTKSEDGQYERMLENKIKSSISSISKDISDINVELVDILDIKYEKES